MEGVLQFYHYNYCIIETLAYFSDFKFVLSLFVIVVVLHFNSRRQVPIYLVDFECYQSPNSHRVPISAFIESSFMREKHFNTSGAAEFQKKVIVRSGLGNETHIPPGMDLIPMDTSYKQSKSEVEVVLFSVTQKLLTKLDIRPESIDILITNGGITCPTPSFASMVINKFGFRSNVRSFHTSGMGCSAGLLAICLAKDLLKVHKNSLALVLYADPICSNSYKGNVKSMLLSNCLFRVGGAAILLSNRKSDKEVAKYELQHIVRTHLGGKDNAYTCVSHKADDEGKLGVYISRDVVEVASEALKINLTSVGQLVLPYSEQLRFAVHFLWKKFSPLMNKKKDVPNFSKAFDHFCIHAGGKAVIEGIKTMLNLSDRDVEASKMTLHRFGNTASSSTWYSLCYLEAKGRVKKGDKVFQLGFGSGFKCNSAAWKCVSREMSKDSPSAWSDRIDQYPVDIPEEVDH